MAAFHWRARWQGRRGAQFAFAGLGDLVKRFVALVASNRRLFALADTRRRQGCPDQPGG